MKNAGGFVLKKPENPSIIRPPDERRDKPFTTISLPFELDEKICTQPYAKKLERIRKRGFIRTKQHKFL